ncbi:adenine phosphoribosyltransferase [Sphingomicrobium clamense]|uniref:Adenine phosphoribosyltransferase n=1 Tax=Sphingomicrobium clamense TaxID=2851013 RepID=A0ABS6V5J0_9SPHN|nr:adenine phosphoribosyltransferase [Sphingomicrobium sp. B8]MBW0144811.1 adenine phosphoribosyltransferase [Sphingomicrobium sp. B8]
MSQAHDELRDLVRTIPDFPNPGIQFRDVTTLLLDPAGLRGTIDALVASVDGPVDLIAAIDARGFAVGGAMATAMGAGLMLIRKDGKLPGATIAEDYALEYGTDRLAVHVDACAPGARVLLVDDLIATGGTAMAAARLVERAGGRLVGARFVINLPDLGGSAKLREAGIEVRSLLEFEGD